MASQFVYSLSILLWLDSTIVLPQQDHLIHASSVKNTFVFSGICDVTDVSCQRTKPERHDAPVLSDFYSIWFHSLTNDTHTTITRQLQVFIQHSCFVKHIVYYITK